MIGAVVGDIVGSIYEGIPTKTTKFPLFGMRTNYTDDTILTIATANSILNKVDYVSSYKYFGRKYTAGYGANFYDWIHSSSVAPYNSWGNGSAMRVSPVGFAFNSIEEVLHEAKKSAETTHNHPEGIKGAQATALAIYLARIGKSKGFIKKEISERFSYDLDRKLSDIRPTYSFEVSCQKSVPESIIAFMESESVEESIRNSVSLGGDADTMACISGGIAQAFYKHIPNEIIAQVDSKIPEEFIEIINEFNSKFLITY